MARTGLGTRLVLASLRHRIAQIWWCSPYIYNKRVHFSGPPLRTSPRKMSVRRSTVFTNELRRHEYEYREVLLTINSNLTEIQKKELHFYYTHYAAAGETLELFRSLEDDKKISWEDVCFLKDGLRAVQRKDLVDIVTEFENKRNLTSLVDMYARKRRGFEESSCCHNSIEQAAAYLERTTTHGISLDGTFYRSLLESRKSIEKVISEFDEAIKHAVLDPWGQLTLLVVVAGEIVTEAFRMSEERRLTSEVISKMCRSAADELYCRMQKLGTWVS